MSIQFENVKGLPILLVKAYPPLVEQDAVENMQHAVELKKQFPGKKIYRVMDFTSGIDFSGMMVCMAAERGQEGGANDPDIMSFFVGSHELVEMGVSALKQQPQYGQPTVFLFTSYDEAYNRAVKEAQAQ